MQFLKIVKKNIFLLLIWLANVNKNSKRKLNKTLQIKKLNRNIFKTCNFMLSTSIVNRLDAPNGLTTVEGESKKLPYPKSVFFIISNEFCERFNYYGMRSKCWINLLKIEISSFTHSTIIIYFGFVVRQCSRAGSVFYTKIDVRRWHIDRALPCIHHHGLFHVHFRRYHIGQLVGKIQYNYDIISGICVG